MAAAANWLRSKPVVFLLAATFILTLALGAGFVVVHHTKDLQGAAAAPPADPLSDDQSRLQVLDAARQFTTAGHLKNATAGYLLMSCKNSDDPPYQGAVRLSFDVPQLKDIPRYFGDLATAMTARGWARAETPEGGERPILTKDGITAAYYLDPDVPGRGAMRIYGECRNVTDHRRDVTGWVDVTDQLRR